MSINFFDKGITITSNHTRTKLNNQAKDNTEIAL